MFAQSIFSASFIRSLDLFVDQQRVYQDQLTEFLGQTSVGMMSEMAKRNLEAWQDVQQNFLRSAGLVKDDAGDSKRPTDKPAKKPPKN